jgi:hypothetical protein
VLVCDGRIGDVAVAVDVGVWRTTGEGVPSGVLVVACNIRNKAQNTRPTAQSRRSIVAF